MHPCNSAGELVFRTLRPYAEVAVSVHDGCNRLRVALVAAQMMGID